MEFITSYVSNNYVIDLKPVKKELMNLAHDIYMDRADAYEAHSRAQGIIQRVRYNSRQGLQYKVEFVEAVKDAVSRGLIAALEAVETN